MTLHVSLRHIAVILVSILVPVSADAQTPAASADGKQTRLILLGTAGGPRGTPDRAQPANVLVVRGTPYLVDAGNGVVHQLDLAGIPFTTIRHVFITHNHDDHDADWGTLMGRAFSAGQHEPMTVYGPRGTESMRKGFLRYFAPNAAARYFEGAVNVPPEKVILAQDIKGAGPVYQDTNIRLTAVENCHYHFSKSSPGYHWQQSFAFRFETPDRVIVFSGDTGPCGDVIARFARGADILVHEVVDLTATERALESRHDGAYSERGQREALMNHMRTEHSTAEEVGRVAQAAEVKLVVLTHLVSGGTAVADSSYIEAVKRSYSGPVVVGRDLMEF